MNCPLNFRKKILDESRKTRVFSYRDEKQKICKNYFLHGNKLILNEYAAYFNLIRDGIRVDYLTKIDK